MFKNSIKYKNYIHEGTNKYWKESLNNPAKYATWIIMGSGGIIKNNLANSKILQEKFNLIYDDGKTKIYKIKTKPGIDLLENLGRKNKKYE